MGDRPTSSARPARRCKPVRRRSIARRARSRSATPAFASPLTCVGDLSRSPDLNNVGNGQSGSVRDRGVRDRALQHVDAARLVANDADDRHAELALASTPRSRAMPRRSATSTMFSAIDERHLHLDELAHEVKVALEVRRVDDDDRHVGPRRCLTIRPVRARSTATFSSGDPLISEYVPGRSMTSTSSPADGNEPPAARSDEPSNV